MNLEKKRGKLRCRAGSGLLGLALWTGLAAAQVEPASSSENILDGSAPLVMTPGAFSQLIVKRNAEVASGLVGVNINLNLMSAEAALYEPVAFSTLSHQRNYRRNTVEEQIVNSSLPILDENVDALDLGVKSQLPTCPWFYTIAQHRNQLRQKLG